MTNQRPPRLVFQWLTAKGAFSPFSHFFFHFQSEEREKREMAPTTCWNLRVSAEANQGGRKYMEDVTAVHFERTNGVEFASFAIFDGHGGREASHFAKVMFLKVKIKVFEIFEF